MWHHPCLAACMGEKSEELKLRSRQFALDVMAFVDQLPPDESNRYLGNQLRRAANGAAANYRASCRSRSRAEFSARVGVAAEEADESAHWLEMLTARRTGAPDVRRKLLVEAHELEAIFSASYGTSRRNLTRG